MSTRRRPAGLAAPLAAQGPGPIPAAAVSSLDLRLRGRTGSPLPGEHRGRGVGVGVELAQLRPYVWGDDPRSLDPAASARHGEPYVREQVPERALTTWICLDRSASTAFGSGLRLKSDVADGVCEVVARLALRRGGRVGVLTYGAPVQRLVAPRGGRASLAHVHRMLGEGVARDGHDATGALAAALWRLHRAARTPGLIVLIGDFRDDDPTWARALSTLRVRHEVLAVELTDERERELPDAGVLSVVDPESGRLVEVDTGSPRVRAAYAAAERDRCDEVRTALRRTGARHVVCDASGDWLRALGAALA